MFGTASLHTYPGTSRAPGCQWCQQTSLVAERREAYDAADRDRHRPRDQRRHPLGAPSEGGARSGRLDAVRDGLTDVADTLKTLGPQVPQRGDAGSLDIGDLDACIAALRRVEGATAAITSRLVACAAAAKAHDAAGLSGTDAYLRNRMGISAREAKKQAELARDLEDMDDATDALADGRLGAEQAAALGRAARRGQLGSPDEVQKRLLGDATTSSPEALNEKIRRAEQAANDDSLRRGENRAHARRRASCSRREDGMWQLHALLDPVGGEAVATAIRAFTTPDAPKTPIRDRRTPEQRTADGLVAAADAALSAGAPVAGGVRPHVSIVIRMAGDQRPATETATDSDQPPREATGPPVDEQPMARPDRDDSTPHGHRAPPVRMAARPTATTGNGATISPDATERLLCDARVTRIVMAAKSQVLDVGRATRTWYPAQRTAITARDGHCRGPGCDRPPDWCHIHHIRWWSKGGGTDLDNGILLCTRHHRLVHEGGWTVVLDPTTHEATFTAPNGTRTTTWPRGSPDPG